MLDILNRIWGLVKKELLQLSRDKLLLAFLLIAPLLELTLMGGMAGSGTENLPLAVVDLDRSRASRELIARLDQTDELVVKAYGDSVAQARQWMQSGKIAAIVVLPPGYGENLADHMQSAEVQVIADGSSYVISSVAIATTENVASEVVQDLRARHAIPSVGPIELRFVARFNASLDGQPSSITMMLGLIVYQVTLIIAAQSFTRERELGTMEQLRVTPLGRVELIVGKAIPTLVVGLLNCLLMIGVIAAWFGVPVRGSLPLLLLLTVPFVLAQIGWGTLISLTSRTQQQAMLFVFALAMIEIACSGFLVPPASMPGIMRALSNVSSIQHYLAIVRGVTLRGAGLSSLWVSALVLCGIALALGGLAWLRLRAGLDADSLQHRAKALWQACQRRRRSKLRARVGRRLPVKRFKPSRKPAYVNVRVDRRE